MEGKIEVILVDIGNTLIKTAEATKGHLGKINTWKSLEELYQAYSPEIPFMTCSTRSVSSVRSNWTVLDFKTPLPIKLDYETPETLGSDRIAAAVGAYDLFPNTNSLVVDMGTCMTMDLISEDGIFNGGVISPGLGMRMKAMSEFTANLPDISQDWEMLEDKYIGKSTKECMLAGAYGGMIHEIEGLLHRLNEDFTSINVILSGGDAHHFESKLKAHIFAGSKIVLMGLYRIWKDLQKS